MPNFSNLFMTQESAPFRVGDQTITLQSRSLRWTPDLGLGGLIWNRPVAVKVQTAGGAEHLLPIQDLTRQREIAIWAIGAAVLLLIWLLCGRRS